jgi:hypothetical protein
LQKRCTAKITDRFRNIYISLHQLFNMGWFSISSVPSADQSANPNASSNPPPAASAPPSEAPPPPRILSRDELAERELQSFLEELEADVRPSSTKYNRVPKLPPPVNQSSSSSGIRPSEANNTLEDQLLPTEMSCRQAFDAAFYCQSLGGQFNNLYRYGGIRSCSENWKDFWFCMKSRSTGDDERSSKCFRFSLPYDCVMEWEVTAGSLERF